jgi:hypothetical protein
MTASQQESPPFWRTADPHMLYQYMLYPYLLPRLLVLVAGFRCGPWHPPMAH